jgi:hypothetical protein
MAATGHDVILTQAFQAIEVAHRLLSLAAEVCGSFRHDLPYQRRPADELPHQHTAMYQAGSGASARPKQDPTTSSPSAPRASSSRIPRRCPGRR